MISAVLPAHFIHTPSSKSPRISGKLEALFVNIGDRVTKGQVIARLDDAEYLQQVEEARAQVKVADATLAEARSTLEAKQRALQRTRHLREQKIASEAELDAAQAEAVAQEARVNLARAQVSQAQAALRAAEVRLGYTTIRADWQGDERSRVVGERFVNEGTTISANAPIVSVLNIQALIGVIYVTERDYPQLEIGQRVRVVAESYPDQAFEGEIVRIAPLFQEASRQARIEIRIPNDNRLLKPRMFVSTRVQLKTLDNATVIPWDALVERENQHGVFVVDRREGIARFVPVTVGVVENDRVQVLDPRLSDEVVTLGQHLLNDGSRIMIAAATDHPATTAQRLTQNDD